MPADPSRRGGRPPLPRPYWVLWTGTLVNRAGTFVEPFAVLYLTSQRGFSPAQVGVALTAFGAGASVSQLVGGWSADHVGRRATLLWGLIASAASLALLGAARGFWPICAAALLVGLAGDLYRPASSALVADLISPAERPRAYALLFWAVNLGFSVAAITAGYLAQHSYTLLFVLDAGTCLVYAGVIAVGIRHDPPRPPASDPDEPAGFGTALRDPLMILLVVLTVLNAVVYFQNGITLPLAVTSDGLPPSAYGLVMAVNGVLIVLFQPLFVRFLPRLDRVRLLAVGSLLIGLGFWLTSFAASTAAYAATVVVWTLGEIGTAGVTSSLVADIAPPEARGRYMAVWGSSFGLAALLAPPFGTWTYQYLGPNALWTGCLIFGVVAAAGFMAIAPLVSRRVVSASSSPR